MREVSKHIIGQAAEIIVLQIEFFQSREVGEYVRRQAAKIIVTQIECA